MPSSTTPGLNRPLSEVKADLFKALAYPGWGARIGGTGQRRMHGRRAPTIGGDRIVASRPQQLGVFGAVPVW